MPRDLSTTYIYHITDVSNLPGILESGGLHADAAMLKAGKKVTGIGYDHIKRRRLTEYKVPSAGGRYVGEFVPFYYCPRSPMLYTINRGNTGRPPGCQTTIVHLVSTVSAAIGLGRPWAISDGNAGSGYAETYSDLKMLDQLDWGAIQANSWADRKHEKMAEFLVADFFEWTAFVGIGCHNNAVAQQVAALIADNAHKPKIACMPNWYY